MPCTAGLAVARTAAVGSVWRVADPVSNTALPSDPLPPADPRGWPLFHCNLQLQSCYSALGADRAVVRAVTQLASVCLHLPTSSHRPTRLCAQRRGSPAALALLLLLPTAGRGPSRRGRAVRHRLGCCGRARPLQDAARVPLPLGEGVCHEQHQGPVDTAGTPSFPSLPLPLPRVCV